MRRRNRRRKPKTAKILRNHALRRAYERCGVAFSRDDILAMEKLIQSNKGTFLARQSHLRGLWRLEYNGLPVFAIYDKARSAITTFLTEEMARTHQTGTSVG